MSVHLYATHDEAGIATSLGEHPSLAAALEKVVSFGDTWPEGHEAVAEEDGNWYLLCGDEIGWVLVEHDQIKGLEINPL